jgi:hypothetical protein
MYVSLSARIIHLTSLQLLLQFSRPMTRLGTSFREVTAKFTKPDVTPVFLYCFYGLDLYAVKTNARI